MPLYNQQGNIPLHIGAIRSQIPLLIPDPMPLAGLLGGRGSSKRSSVRGSTKEKDYNMLPGHIDAIKAKERDLQMQQYALKQKYYNILDKQYSGDFKRFYEDVVSSGQYMQDLMNLRAYQDQISADRTMAVDIKKKFIKMEDEARKNDALESFYMDRSGNRLKKFDTTGNFIGYQTIADVYETAYGSAGLVADPTHAMFGRPGAVDFPATYKPGTFQAYLESLAKMTTGYTKYTEDQISFPEILKGAQGGEIENTSKLFSWIAKVRTEVLTNEAQRGSVLSLMQSSLTQPQYNDMMQEYYNYIDTHGFANTASNHAQWLQDRIRKVSNLVDKYDYSFTVDFATLKTGDKESERDKYMKQIPAVNLAMGKAGEAASALSKKYNRDGKRESEGAYGTYVDPQLQEVTTPTNVLGPINSFISSQNLDAQKGVGAPVGIYDYMKPGMDVVFDKNGWPLHASVFDGTTLVGAGGITRTFKNPLPVTDDKKVTSFIPWEDSDVFIEEEYSKINPNVAVADPYISSGKPGKIDIYQSFWVRVDDKNKLEALYQTFDAGKLKKKQGMTSEVEYTNDNLVLLYIPVEDEIIANMASASFQASGATYLGEKREEEKEEGVLSTEAIWQNALDNDNQIEQ